MLGVARSGVVQTINVADGDGHGFESIQSWQSDPVS
jgi:hypothetical protein